MRVLIVILLAALVWPSVHAGHTPDCQTTGDAGDAAASASPLVAPVALCAASLSDPADRDWYAVDSVAGGRLRAVLRGDDAQEGGSFEACLWDPQGTRVVCGQSMSVDTAAAGVWKLEVFPHSLGRHYLLSIGTRVSDHAGSAFVGHDLAAPPRVNEMLGPEAPGGLDGDWIDLAGPAAAGEWVVSPSGALSVRFYDATSHPMASCDDVVSDPCPVPAGATSGFVFRKSTPWPILDPGWALEHVR